MTKVKGVNFCVIKEDEMVRVSDYDILAYANHKCSELNRRYAKEDGVYFSVYKRTPFTDNLKFSEEF